MTQPDHGHGTQCPVCNLEAFPRAVRFDGPIKLITYQCQTCQRHWEGAERWVDEWLAGAHDGPRMLHEDLLMAARPAADDDKPH